MIQHNGYIIPTQGKRIPIYRDSTVSIKIASRDNLTMLIPIEIFSIMGSPCIVDNYPKNQELINCQHYLFEPEWGNIKEEELKIAHGGVLGIGRKEIVNFRILSRLPEISISSIHFSMEEVIYRENQFIFKQNIFSPREICIKIKFKVVLGSFLLSYPLCIQIGQDFYYPNIERQILEENDVFEVDFPIPIQRLAGTSEIKYEFRIPFTEKIDENGCLEEATVTSSKTIFCSTRFTYNAIKRKGDPFFVKFFPEKMDAFAHLYQKRTCCNKDYETLGRRNFLNGTLIEFPNKELICSGHKSTIKNKNGVENVTLISYPLALQILHIRHLNQSCSYLLEEGNQQNIYILFVPYQILCHFRYTEDLRLPIKFIRQFPLKKILKKEFNEISFNEDSGDCVEINESQLQNQTIVKECFIELYFEVSYEELWEGFILVHLKKICTEDNITPNDMSIANKFTFVYVKNLDSIIPNTTFNSF